MNFLEKTLLYVALGVSVIALGFAFSLASKTPNQLGAAAPNVNCNGRAYCTAWNDILFRNASSTNQVDTVNIKATGTITLSGQTTFSGEASSTANNFTLGCLRVYQTGATTVASSTFFVVASTTGQVGGLAGSYPLYATTTKPTYCN